jgi:hypothetical protein
MMNSPRVVALLHARNSAERRARMCRIAFDEAQAALARATAEVERIQGRIGPSSFPRTF